MKTTLIVLGHPERGSFNGAWSSATEAACTRLGHEVMWSDLSSMAFDPVESAAHYGDLLPGQTFDPLKFQEAASAQGRLPQDVAAEVGKIERADRIVFHFPLWWFSPPALLKGWLERVFVHGRLHRVTERFDTGTCLGKKALFCVTTGSSEVESAHNGKEGDVQMLLWPMAYTLRYLGFTVLRPIIVHGVHGYHSGDASQLLYARLQRALKDQDRIMSDFDDLPAMAFNADGDFDAEGRLKAESECHSCFIRHAV